MTRGAVRVLVVEDDENLRVAVCTDLAAAGFDVTAAADLATADGALNRTEFACAVFDRKLPDGDAIDYVHRRRLAGCTVPVLYLTAMSSVADRVAGFASGGDDYVVKPFSVAELTARVRTVGRRAGRSSVLRYADLEMDCARREVRRTGVLLSLSAREFAVLEYLMIRPEHVVTRSDLIEHCWDEANDPMSNVVDAVVLRLRRKLHEPTLLHTVRGRGYRLALGSPVDAG